MTNGFSARAVAAGLGVGIVLCAASLFVGLKIGITDSGNVTASILGFALGRTLLRAGSRYSVHENQVTHGLAASMGNAPLVVGLLGVLPALSLLDISWSPLAAALWGLALGVAGIALAWVYRFLLDDRHLPFPTGVATAELICAMHADPRVGLSRGRALVGGAAGAALFTWMRDLPPRWLPAVTWLPGQLAGRSAESLTVGIAWSPMLAGVGALVGLPVAAAAFVGSLLAWVGLAPSVTAPDADFAAVVAWTAWPGAALLMASSVPAAASAMIARSRRTDATSGRWRWGLALAALPLALVPLGAWLFGGPLWVIAAGLLLAPFGAFLSARAAGATDISPYGVLGQLTQVGVGQAVSTAGGPIGAGAAVGGVGVQVSSTLWVLRAGERLGTPLRPQIGVQLLGLAAGVAVAVPLYLVLVAAHGIGTAELPAVAAQTTRAAAVLTAEGGGLPPGAGLAAGLALVLGILLSAAPTRRWVSVAGLGVGMLIPVAYASIILFGALVAELYRRRWPDGRDRLGAVAAGLIVGETIVGVGSAAAAALR